MLTRDSTELTDPGVVPSLADRWSHHTGGTQLKVVPCHWRATRQSDPTEQTSVESQTVLNGARCVSTARSGPEFCAGAVQRNLFRSVSPAARPGTSALMVTSSCASRLAAISGSLDRSSHDDEGAHMQGGTHDS